MSVGSLDIAARVDARSLLRRVNTVVYLLATLVFLSLLVVGTVAVLAAVKGTWHWQIHLESTVSYMAVFVSYLLAALVPLFGVSVVGRWWLDG
jgi:flagellar biosynthesis protein FlhB